MADILSPSDRSRNMSAIKSKNTKPEVYFRKCLFQLGYRYRLHSKKIVGHPDIYLRKFNTAIFVHGCFWHRHKECKFAYMPKSNQTFWIKKFNENIERDKKVRESLEKSGIKCLVVWECSIKKMASNPEYRNHVLEATEKFLISTEGYAEI